LRHPQSAARLRDPRSLDRIGAAVARGVSRYLATDRNGRSGRYGSVATLDAPVTALDIADDEEAGPRQACYRTGALEEQGNWWDSHLPVGALTDTAPAQLRELLSYLHVSFPTFAPREDEYFTVLGEH